MTQTATKVDGTDTDTPKGACPVLSHTGHRDKARTNVRLSQMSAREEAEARMTQAKQLFTRAAKATLAGLPLAAAMSAAALDEIEQARAEIQRLDDRRVDASQSGRPARTRAHAREGRR